MRYYIAIEYLDVNGHENLILGTWPGEKDLRIGEKLFLEKER